jgi:hypothetical protein
MARGGEGGPLAVDVPSPRQFLSGRERPEPSVGETEERTWEADAVEAADLVFGAEGESLDRSAVFGRR